MRVVRDDRPVAANIEVRSASARDGREIGALCRRVPAAGPAAGPATFTWIDHGDTWWDAVGCRPGRHVFVAERDGAIVGVHAVAIHPARLSDRPITLALLGPTRIDPSTQGSGAFRTLQRAVATVVDAEAAEPYALVPVGDPPPRLPLLLRRWPVRVHRSAIECRGAARFSPEVHRAEVADAAALVAQTRADAVLAPTGHRDAIHQRVAGGGGYGADRLLTNGEAVVGVSRWVTVLRDERGGPPRRQATAWDVGASSPIALESLVRAWCARLADEGIDDLVIWSCAGDVVHRAVAPLASASTAHAVDLGLTPPADAAPRGVAVDAALL